MAIKNDKAIGAGISDGIGYGANARTALITRGLAEISRLGLSLGAEPHTFMGMACLGIWCLPVLTTNRVTVVLE